ncbi:hypothetical protein BGZ95_003765, partial [Linnemannia exigua]
KARCGSHVTRWSQHHRSGSGGNAISIFMSAPCTVCSLRLCAGNNTIYNMAHWRWQRQRWLVSLVMVEICWMWRVVVGFIQTCLHHRHRRRHQRWPPGIIRCWLLLLLVEERWP